MAEVVEKTLQYKKYLDKYVDKEYDESKILLVFKKLDRQPITLEVLQDTGVGKSVNSYRKHEGGIGEKARELVGKWKKLVAVNSGPPSVQCETVCETTYEGQHTSSAGTSMKAPYMDNPKDRGSPKETVSHLEVKKEKFNDGYGSSEDSSKHKVKQKIEDGYGSSDGSADGYEEMKMSDNYASLDEHEEMASLYRVKKEEDGYGSPSGSSSSVGKETHEFDEPPRKDHWSKQSIKEEKKDRHHPNDRKRDKHSSSNSHSSSSHHIREGGHSHSDIGKSRKESKPRTSGKNDQDEIKQDSKHKHSRDSKHGTQGNDARDKDRSERHKGDGKKHRHSGEKMSDLDTTKKDSKSRRDVKLDDTVQVKKEPIDDFPDKAHSKPISDVKHKLQIKQEVDTSSIKSEDSDKSKYRSSKHNEQDHSSSKKHHGHGDKHSSSHHGNTSSSKHSSSSHGDKSSSKHSSSSHVDKHVSKRSSGSHDDKNKSKTESDKTSSGSHGERHKHKYESKSHSSNSSDKQIKSEVDDTMDSVLSKSGDSVTSSPISDTSKSRKRRSEMAELNDDDDEMDNNGGMSFADMLSMPTVVKKPKKRKTASAGSDMSSTLPAPSEHSEKSRDKSSEKSSSSSSHSHREKKHKSSHKHKSSSDSHREHHSKEKHRSMSEKYKEKGNDIDSRGSAGDLGFPSPPRQPMSLSEADILSTLPDISPNYKPLPHVDLDASSARQRAIEALDEKEIGTKKNTKTAVYSGRKTVSYLTAVPSLYDSCMRVLMDNIDALEFVGGVPYDILKPVLAKCTPQQLYALEDCNPQFIGETDELWEKHATKDFRSKKPGEFESWRELYIRLHDERDKRLKNLTASICAGMHKATPVRKTQLAYVDTTAKAPRGVRRQQLKHGTAGPSGPMDPLVKLSSHHKEGDVIPRPPIPRGEHGRQPKQQKQVKLVAPMMAKTLRFMKKIQR